MAQHDRATTGRSFWWLPLCVVIALLGATISLANTASRVGLVIPQFSALGPAFYAWRRDLQQAEVRLNRSATPQRAAAVRSVATRIQAGEPLAVPAWRALASATDTRSGAAAARPVMLAAEALTRRDPVVQAWLIEDAIERRSIGQAVHHFDLLLRTSPEARPDMLRRLASILNNAEARRDLAPFIRANNIWFGEFNIAASQRRGPILPYAQLLAAAERLPAEQAHRDTYAIVVERLVREGEFTMLRRLYPRLPGSDTALLTRLDLGDGDRSAYLPIGWVLTEGYDAVGALVAAGGGSDNVALEAMVQPLSNGIIARRLVWPPRGARAIRWRVSDIAASSDATAVLQLRCLDAVASSGNLLSRGALRSLALPASCPVAMVELTMNGGTGRDPATFLLSNIGFDTAAPATGARR